MAVTVIDPGQGALAQAIGKLGAGVASKVFEKQNREKELTQDPTKLQALWPVYDAAKKAGPDAIAAFEEALGVRPGFAESHIATLVQPTLQQETEQGFRAAGGVPLSVESSIQGLKTELTRLNFDQTYLDVATELGLPSLKAAAEAAGFEFDEASNSLNSDMLQLSIEQGIPELKLNLEAAQAQLGVDAIEGYNQYIADLPDTAIGRHYKNMASIAIANPGFGSHVAFHENLNAETAARLAERSDDPAEKLLIFTRWRTALTDAQDRLRAAEDSEAREQAQRDINGLRLYGESLIQSGAMLPVELTGAREASRLFGLRKTIETFGVEPQLVDPLAQAASMVVSGQHSLEELQNSPAFRSLDSDVQIKLTAAIASSTQEGTSQFMHGEGGVETSEESSFQAFDRMVHEAGVGPAMAHAGAETIDAVRMGFAQAFGKNFTPFTREEIYNTMLSDQARAALDAPNLIHPVDPATEINPTALIHPSSGKVQTPTDMSLKEPGGADPIAALPLDTIRLGLSDNVSKLIGPSGPQQKQRPSRTVPDLGEGQVYEKNGRLVYDSSNQDPNGRTRPTHVVDLIQRRLQPGQTVEQLEAEVLNRAIPDTAADVVRDISALDEDVASVVPKFLRAAQDAGFELMILETKRPQIRQDWLFQSGRSRPGPIVTWTLTSDHASGRAVDLLPKGTNKDAAFHWIQENGPKFGFTVLGSADPGHISMPR